MLYFISDMPAPSTHNFIDGFIKRYCNERNIQYRIHCCGRDSSLSIDHVSAPYLKRRGLNRLINIIIAFTMMVFYYKKKDVIIVRNDIFLLFGLWCGACLTGKQLYYNKSFPFELLLTGMAQRCYIFLLVFLCNHIAGIIILSKRTKAKLRKLGIYTPSIIIPLAIDDRLISKNKNIWQNNDISKPQFIYFGTMDNQRGLHDIFKTIIPTIQQHNGIFTIIPRYMREYEQAKYDYAHYRNVQIIAPQDKNGLANYLTSSHISLCLIPPIDLYLESSPTKFYESLGAGLIVIANQEIRQICHYTQKYSIEQSILCDFNNESMIAAINDAVEKLHQMADKNYNNMRDEYIRRNQALFSYPRYDDDFTVLITNS